MFFYTSKILEFFIYPFSWIIILTVAALIVKKTALKNKLVVTAVIVLFVFSEPILLNEFAKWWDIKPVPLQKTSGYSCAIVLGGFGSEGVGGSDHFNYAADRFIQTLKLYETGKVTHIMVSGGNGGLIPDKFKEADWVKTQLEEFKVPDSAILIEDKSRNTIENARFTKLTLDSAHLQPPYILVTSAFHMRRAMQIFKKTKIDVVPYPCNYLAPEGYTNLDDLMPDPQVLANWNIYIKEAVGTFVNYLR